MRQYIFSVLLGVSVITPAHAASDAERAMMGAIIGGAFGAVIGNEAGGRDGAIMGSAIGAATGTAIITRDSRAPQTVYVSQNDPVIVRHEHVYRHEYVYFDDHQDRGWHRGHHHRRHHRDDDDD